MKKLFIVFTVAFFVLTLSCCKAEPLISSADIHELAAATDNGRCYTNTTGKYLYHEIDGDKIYRRPFGRDIHSLCFSNGNIYYLDEWFENNEIAYVLYRYDGNESISLTDAERYRVIGDTVIYKNGDTLYKLEKDKTEPTVIMEEFTSSDFDADSENIYWRDGEKVLKQDIYCCNHKGDKLRKLTEGGGINEFIVKDGYIYYTTMDDSSLFRMDVKTKEVQTIISAKEQVYVNDFKFANGKIYYNNGQMRVNPDGSEQEKLFDFEDYRRLSADLRSFDIDDRFMYFSKTLEDTKTNLIRIPLEEILEGKIETVQILDPFDSDNRWKTYKESLR